MHERAIRAAVIVLAIACGLVCWHFASHGRYMQALLAALAPALLWSALRYPAFFPYGLFAVLVPFDNLLDVGGGGTLTRLLGLATGAAFAVRILRERRIVTNGVPLAWILAALLYFGVTLAWSIDPATGRTDWQTLFQLAALYAVVSLAPLRAAELRVVLAAVVAGGVLAALYGVWMFHDQMSALQSAAAASRLNLGFGNRTIDVNLFADSMILPLAISLTAWLACRWNALKLLLTGGIAVMLYAMSLTASRESFIAVGLTFGYLAWRSRWRARVLPVLAGMVLVGISSPMVRARFANSLSTGGAGRTSIWHVAIKAFEHRPILGWGFGSFAAAYNRFFMQVYQSYDAGWTRASHDLFMHYGVEGGIVGIALVLAIWWTQWSAARRTAAIPAVRDWANAVTAAFIGLFIAGLFIDIFATKTLWLAFCLAAQLRSAAAERPGRQRPRATYSHARWAGSAAAALLFIAILPAQVRAAAAPAHVRTYLYYGAADTNVAVPASFMASHATFVETDGGHHRLVEAFKAAGGTYAVSYADPTFVPYCRAPFVAPAGRCSGPVGNTPGLPESAWLHETDGARLHRFDSYTGEYQEILNPLSPAVHDAVRRYTRQLAFPGIDAFFSDDTGSEVDGTFESFGGRAQEIAGAPAWRTGEERVIEAFSLPVILNGSAADWGPAYGGAMLRLPNVIGVNFEGCFSSSDAGMMGERHGYWLRMQRALLNDARFGKYVVCMMSGPFDAQQRLYALASWWLTYRQCCSVAAPVTRAPDGYAVYPEYDIVPQSPVEAAAEAIEKPAPGGAYVRRFDRCYQRGRPIGPCAAAVNPSMHAARLPASVRAYRYRLRVDPQSAYTGGRARWIAAASQMLAPMHAVILLR